MNGQSAHDLEMVRGLDDPRLLAALEANTYAAYADYARNPEGEVVVAPTMLSFMSGISAPLFNGIARARFNPDKLDAQITAALRPFVARGLPMYWWIDPSTRPADLGAHLLSHGLLRDGDMPGMAIDLLSMGQVSDTSNSLTVTPVTTAPSIAEWTRTAQQGYEMPPALLPALLEMTTRTCLSPEPRWMSFLGHINGRPVATSQLFLHDGVAGIYCVSTLPDARRHGYGAEVTRHALLHARDLGYRVGVLQSSQMGLHVYEDLGFRTLMTFDLYALPGARPHDHMG